MGQLVTLDQLNQGLGWSWYFSEFDNKYPKLPCSAFPYSLAIRRDTIDEPHATNYDLKRRIRTWVIESVSDIVILDIIKKDYYHYWSDSHDGGYNLVWSYHVFHFGNEAEALMFKLAFSEYISEILPYDPAKLPNYIQSAQKDFARAKDSFDRGEERYNEATKKKDRLTTQTLNETFDAKLQDWNGETDLSFADQDNNEIECPELQQRYRRLYNLRRDERRLKDILDIHSTFVPKSRY